MASAPETLQPIETAPEADELDLGTLSAEAPEDARGTSYASLTGVKPTRHEPLDLGLEQVEDEPAGNGGGDDLLLDASRLAEEDAPIPPLVPRRRAVLSNAPEADVPAPRGAASGNTLFERMANLSRGVKPAAAEDEDDGDDDGSAISIPRFLGRQNNQ